MYKYRHLHLNNQLNRELLPTSGIRAGLSAITPGCHSACQSIARLLHQSASGVACNVCVTPPTCVYSLLKSFNELYLTLILSITYSLISRLPPKLPALLNISWYLCRYLLLVEIVAYCFRFRAKQSHYKRCVMHWVMRWEMRCVLPLKWELCEDSRVQNTAWICVLTPWPAKEKF